MKPKSYLLLSAVCIALAAGGFIYLVTNRWSAPEKAPLPSPTTTIL